MSTSRVTQSHHLPLGEVAWRCSGLECTLISSEIEFAVLLIGVEFSLYIIYYCSEKLICINCLLAHDATLLQVREGHYFCATEWLKEILLVGRKIELSLYLELKPRESLAFKRGPQKKQLSSNWTIVRRIILIISQLVMQKSYCFTTQTQYSMGKMFHIIWSLAHFSALCVF